MTSQEVYVFIMFVAMVILVVIVMRRNTSQYDSLRNLFTMGRVHTPLGLDNKEMREFEKVLRQCSTVQKLYLMSVLMGGSCRLIVDVSRNEFQIVGAGLYPFSELSDSHEENK